MKMKMTEQELRDKIKELRLELEKVQGSGAEPLADVQWDCEVYRTRGIKQPHLQDDAIPTFTNNYVVYFGDDESKHFYGNEVLRAEDWETITAFIEL